MSRVELVRLPDWDERLNALIAWVRNGPIDWGTHDCALFGANVVLAQTGVDHGAAFRGLYTDAEGAALVLRDIGRGTITRTFDAFLPRRPIALLRRGDLAMVGKGREAAIGLVWGGDALLIGEAGLEPRTRRLWTRGWGVG